MRESLRDRAKFLATSGYYLGIFFCLLTFGKAPRSFGLMGRLRGLVKRSQVLTSWQPESGFCYQIKIPAHLLSDADGKSRVVVYENSVPLMKAHASHDEVRNLGSGAYSHWNEMLYISTSDNSDPRSNGRGYTYAEV